MVEDKYKRLSLILSILLIITIIDILLLSISTNNLYKAVDNVQKTTEKILYHAYK